MARLNSGSLIAVTVAVAVITLGTVCVNGQADDISTDEWIFRSTALPEDIKTYATVGNGHVATVMHRDSVFMNGIYSGERGFSHRARIPTRNNIKVTSVSGTQPTNRFYELNVREGYYVEELELEGYRVQIRTYAHRYYHTVIVTQILVQRVSGSGTVRLLFTNDAGNETSSDIDFTATDLPDLNATQYCGPVRFLEDKKYQDSANPPRVCVLSKKLPDAEVVVSASGEFWFYTSYAKTREVALNEYIEVRTKETQEPGEIFTQHTAAWRALWDTARIEVAGNVNISKVINGAFYYLLSSLPITTQTLNPVGQFYGLSPGSLSFGAHDDSKPDLIERPMDYQGHSFWDTETWMFPPILFFHPDKAQQLLNYRMNNIAAARDRAHMSGYRGARFPWESGFTGREVTPDCCEETRDLQIHVSADILYAVRQYIALTQDLDWLKNKSPQYVTNVCGLVREVADFFTSRSCYNENGFYDINGVMPPDEDNYNNDNNGYTNVMAGYAIFFAKYAECLCGTSMPEPIPERWLEIARSLKFLYDEASDYHPEFEAFNLSDTNQRIKQADVVLLGYPVMYEMAASTRANDLRIYEGLTRPDGPAMTWAMHTVGWLDLNNETNANAMFAKSYSSYMRQPFKTWTEAIYPNSGAHNFITGMGGFLQSIINGYAGIRLHPEEMVFRKPRVLPLSTSVKLVGVKYLSKRLDITITPTSTQIIMARYLDGPQDELIVEHAGRNETLIDNQPLTIDTSGDDVVFKIFAAAPTNCPLPEDRIGINRLVPPIDEGTTMPQIGESTSQNSEPASAQKTAMVGATTMLLFLSALFLAK